MEKKDMIFELVKSLSKSEKRHFQLFLKKQGSNSGKLYIALFHKIAQQVEYNDKPIKQLFRNTSCFYEAKAYLYEQLLKSLNDFHSNGDVGLALNRQVQFLKVLYNKELFHHAKRLLAKVKRTAYKYECFPVILDLLQTEKQLLFKDQDVRKLTNNTAAILKEENRIIELQKNLCAYESLMLHSRSDYFRSGIRNFKEHKNLSSSSTKSALLNDYRNALSFRAKDIFYYTNGTYAFLSGDIKKLYSFTFKNVQLYDKNILRSNYFSSRYVVVLFNHLVACALSKKNTQADIVLKKLKAIYPSLKHEKWLTFGKIYNMELNICLANKHFDSGIQLIPEIKKGLRDGENKIGKEYEFLLHCQVANLFFNKKDYKEASRWLLPVINSTDINMRPDIQASARILNLAIQFESGKYDLLEYSTKSTYRYLEKKGKLYQTEKSFIAFLKRMKGINSEKNGRQELIKFKKELVSILKSPIEQRLAESFNILFWVSGRIKEK